MIHPSKILIVDDEPFNVDYLEQELENLGYETVNAANGQEALQKVTAEAPDLILLDVMMPIMDGFTVCRILKGNEETRFIPIVIMTALDGIDDRIKGIEAGADDFLTKPINQRELFARIETALKLKHTVDRKIGELRRIRDHFAKFVPEAVKRLVTANPEAPELAVHEQDVSILLVDISGYTILSERLPLRDLNALVDRIRAGTSVVILPEGTRSATPTLGRFKKGAFHLARQAKVPIVPIVIRNAGELMWRRSKVVNPGTVQVAVLDPVPTDDWSADNLDVHIGQIRDAFAATLEKWPT